MRTLLIAAVLCFTASVALASDDRALKVQSDQMRAEKRVALVIGNGAYESAPLRNPLNDARLMAGTLRELGFNVVTLENGTLRQMTEKVSEFGRLLKGGGVGLFYYAGHGMQVNGNNYLVPVKADIEVEGDVPLESMDVSRVLARMDEAGNRMNIVILDACRNNPFNRSFRSSEKGLATLEAPKGTYIAYATAPGSIAADGDGDNGAFTRELASRIKTEGLEIDMVFRQVRTGVRKATGDRQTPWTSSSIEGEFYFKLPTDKDPLAKGTVEAEPLASLSAKTMDKPAVSITAKGEPQVDIDGMVLVKGGCYQRGDIFGDGMVDERPVQEVCVGDFYISRYEVTQGEWAAVMGGNPSYFNTCGEDCPVENVSWDEAQEFLKKLRASTGRAYRLPTEAEWEYAARSGGKRERFAGSDSPDSVAWYYRNSAEKSYPVGRKQPNGLGIHDMSGNVWEWCADWYGENYYALGVRDNPAGPSSGKERVLRGGAWGGPPQGVPVSNRFHAPPSYSLLFTGLGLRLARTP